MIERSVRLVAVASLQIWFAAVSLESSCPAYNLSESFEQSAAVFVGRAVAQRIVATSAERHETETQFVASSVWKGDVKTALLIRTWGCGGTIAAERGETVTCAGDVAFDVGSTYLVFAAGTPLETQACGPTDQIERATRTLEWLSEKPFKRAG